MRTFLLIVATAVVTALLIWASAPGGLLDPIKGTRTVTRIVTTPAPAQTCLYGTVCP